MPVAVITGSSSGIGHHTAIEFARRGYSVLLHARHNLAGLQETAQRVAESQMNDRLEVRCITADIACPNACKSLVQAAFGWQRSVNAWVNCAGADLLTGPLRELSFERKLQSLLEVDVAGTIRVSRLAAEAMSREFATNRCIINVGWDQANLGMEGDAGQLFCTAKSAVEAFSRSLAMTIGPEIRVNCVAPGWINTKWAEQSASQYWKQRAASESLTNRWGEPSEVAACIGWLSSESARFVNGQCIPVNGGRRYFPDSPQT